MRTAVKEVFKPVSKCRLRGWVEIAGKADMRAVGHWADVRPDLNGPMIIWAESTM